MNAEQGILEATDALVRDAVAREPELSGHPSKILTAVAYYIRASSLGRPLSMYDAEEMFGVADSAFRKCYKTMAKALGVTQTLYARERSRNSYDIYAEILKNEGSLITALIRKTHVKYSEMTKHTSFLVKHGLLKEVKEGRSMAYFPTEKGHAYLDLYARLRALFTEHD